jgi:hypothetical protein
MTASAENRGCTPMNADKMNEFVGISHEGQR